MTPEQKVKWLIVAKYYDWSDVPPPPYPCEGIEEFYEDIVEQDAHWDAESEVRCTGIETGLPSEYSRHYESEAVAARLPDGSWVGWTYWYGGGKHGEPEAIDWIEHTYDVQCKEEEKLVTVREFSKPKKDEM